REREEREREEKEKERLEREQEREQEGEEEGGGFLSLGSEGVEAMPTAGSARVRERVILSAGEQSEDSDIYMPSDGNEEINPGYTNPPPTSTSPSSSPTTKKRKHTPPRPQSPKTRNLTEEAYAGGFLPTADDDKNDNEGGFIPETDDPGAAGGFLFQPSAPGDDDEFTTPRRRKAPRRERASIGTANASASAGEEEEKEEQKKFPPQPSNVGTASPAIDTAIEKEEEPIDDTGAALPSSHRSIEEHKEERSMTDVEEGVEDIPLHRTMTDAELEEGRMLQELYESGEMMKTAGAPPQTRLPKQSDEVDDADDRDTIGGEAGENAEIDADKGVDYVGDGGSDQPSSLGGEVEEEEEEEEDKGSLLSEDPDDEDAEPEWLV
ncbi:MAG: hypothetical protein L6R39_004695, partial [Caloplaca ligustica]